MQEINLPEFESDARKSFDKFIQTISSVDKDYFNVVPFTNSWTAGQVGEHVFKFQSLILQVTDIAVPTVRAFDEYAKHIKNTFLNFNIKMDAPEYVRPGNELIDKNSLIADLENTAKKILHLIKIADLKLLCKGFDFPTVGALTRFEWIAFGIYHTQRHTHQVENIIHYHS